MQTELKPSTSTVMHRPRILLAKPVFDDEMKEAAIQAFQNEHFVLGESVYKFEEEFARYCGTRFAVSTASGTAALVLSMIAKEVGGGEVLTTPASFVASANSIIHAGATPQFADIDLKTYTIDPAKVRLSLSDKARALVPVHLYGYPAAMKELCEIASKRGIATIEDACLPPRQEVCTIHGWVPIERVELQERVLGCDGEFHHVTKLHRRPYSGILVTIVPWSTNFPLSVTPEHTILACKAYRGNGRWTIRPTFSDYEKCGRATEHYDKGISWVSAASLNIGDFLLVHIPSCSDVSKLSMKHRTKQSWNTKELPKELEVTADLLYLCGLYVAEGCALDDCVEISNSSNDVIGEYCDAMDDTFRLGYRIYDRGTYQLVRTYSSELARLFTSWFGTHALNKRIPEWIWMLPPHVIAPFVRGLWDGDGCYYESSRRRQTLAYRTTSKQLAKQLSLLLAKIGVVSTIQVSGSGFDVRVQSDDSGERLAGVLGLEWNQPLAQSRQTACFFHKGYLWIPIKDTRRGEYSGFVYNLEVESANSYLSEFVTTHNCQAHGASYGNSKVGSLGDAGCFSFFPSKNMTVGGDGGMVVTNDELVAETVASLRDCGRAKGSKYIHDKIGYTERLNTVQAAIGRVQLKRLDVWNEMRRRIASSYYELLSDLDDVAMPPPGDAVVSPVYHMYVLRCNRRDDLRAWLGQQGVETGVHYSEPIHLQPVYRELSGYSEGSFPNSEALCKTALSIPMHPDLTSDEISFVSETIHRFYAK